MEETKSLIMKYYKLEGVRGIRPMKARGHFAKAVMLEDEAGKTTPEAEEQLALAIQALK